LKIRFFPLSLNQNNQFDCESQSAIDSDGRVHKLGVHDAEGSKRNGLFEWADKFPGDGSVPKKWKQLVSKQRKDFDVQRKMCQLQWRDLEAIGIELAGTVQLYADQWQFPNVAAALAPGGALFARPHALHCFLGAQPIYVNNNVSNVPYLVFIDCEVPPPALLADHRLQKEREVLIPMAQLAMSWAPYLPHSISDIGPGELPTECRINVLTWKRRPENFAPLMILKELKELATLYPVAKDPDALQRAEQLVARALPDAYKAAGQKYVVSMRRMADMSPDECKREVNALEDAADERFMEQLHKWEYLMPYHVRPQLFPDAPHDVTAVSFDFAYRNKDGTPQTASLDFDKEIDRLVLFVQDFRDSHPDADPASLGDDGATLQQAVRDAFKAKREREAAAFEEKVGRLRAYTDAQIEKLRQMRVFKFYPNHPTIDVSPFVDKKVNIYFGDADVTAPPLPGYVAPLSPAHSLGRGMSKFATPQSSRKPSMASSSSFAVAATPSASVAVADADNDDDDDNAAASATTPIASGRKRGRATAAAAAAADSNASSSTARSKSQSRSKRARTPSRTPSRK
jgi:hypothetical protein